MKSNILLLLTLSLLLACSKDNITTDLVFSDTALEARKKDNKVTICHSTGNGGFHPISVNQNALSAHLRHGDYIPDADGDGYTAIGSCTGSKDDCDDQDASVHPGSGFCNDCGCFDLESLSNSNLLFYYNTGGNDCSIYDNATGVIVFYQVGSDTLVALAGVEEDGQKIVGRGQVLNGIVQESADGCKLLVGTDITEAQYDACLEGLQTVININQPLAHVCDIVMPPVFPE